MKISSRWYAGCSNQKDKEERKTIVIGCAEAVELARAVLEKELADMEAKAISESTYDSPAWAYLQADLNGARRQMKRVIEFLTIKGD